VPYLRDLSIGANAKLLKLTGKLDDRPEADASGWGWDVGVLYNLGALPYVPDGLNFGLMVHDGGNTRVKHETGVKEDIQLQNIRWGLSYRPFEEWLVKKFPISNPVFALDFDDRVHLGLEFWLARALALRAGLQKDLDGEEKVTLAFGLGFTKAFRDLPEVNVDYALTDSPVLPNTSKQFSGSLIMKDNPRLIRIVEAHINDVFASLYRHHGLPGASVGSIKLKNVSKFDTFKVSISFLANRYMKPQRPDTMTIAPGRTIDFPLRAVFEPEILDAPEGRLTGEVKVAYEHNKSEHASSAGVDFALYGKNYLTWDDPGKAAAFVTFDDPVVKSFLDQARAVKLDTSKAPWFFRYNMAEALTIFNALKAYGITYRLDPVTPFPSLADTLRGSLYRLDKILYPAELLQERAGDCDDLSVLYASLLQRAGLPAALVSVPGHIFIMVDTRIDTSQRRSLPVAPNKFVERKGTFWMPIETTMIPTSSFIEAWTAAAARYDTTWKIYEVAAYQGKYPPISPGLIRTPYTLRQPIRDFTPALQNDLIALETMKTQWLQKVESILEREMRSRPPLEAAKARNVYAALLGQNDEYARAKEQIQKVLALDSTYAPAWNNLGNVEFITGNFVEAEKAYSKALAYNQFSRGTYLNLAILYQMMIEGAAPRDSADYQRKTDKALLQAAQLLEGDMQSAYVILGLPEEPTDTKAESLTEKLKRRIKQVKDFVDQAFKKHLGRKKIEAVILDRHGAKGRGEIDEDRSALLSWSY
jgi:tetratricopeptide (TPR) repeat protein